MATGGRVSCSGPPRHADRASTAGAIGTHHTPLGGGGDVDAEPDVYAGARAVTSGITSQVLVSGKVLRRILRAKCRGEAAVSPSPTMQRVSVRRNPNQRMRKWSECAVEDSESWQAEVADVAEKRCQHQATAEIGAGAGRAAVPARSESQDDFNQDIHGVHASGAVLGGNEKSIQQTSQAVAAAAAAAAIQAGKIPDAPRAELKRCSLCKCEFVLSPG